jgi:hypothetical protein
MLVLTKYGDLTLARFYRRGLARPRFRDPGRSHDILIPESASGVEVCRVKGDRFIAGASSCEGEDYGAYENRKKGEYPCEAPCERASYRVPKGPVT